MGRDELDTNQNPKHREKSQAKSSRGEIGKQMGGLPSPGAALLLELLGNGRRRNEAEEYEIGRGRDGVP